MSEKLLKIANDKIYLSSLSDWILQYWWNWLTLYKEINIHIAIKAEKLLVNTTTDLKHSLRNRGLEPDFVISINGTSSKRHHGKM